MKVDISDAKAEARRTLAPGNPGREALLVAPDSLDESTFDALVPTWIRLLRLKEAP